MDRFGCCRGLIEVGEGAVWVAGAREVIRIDPASGKVLARIRAPLRDACEMTVGEGAVWVASCLTGLPPRTGPDELWRIDPTTNEVVATLSLPPHAAVMLTRGGGYVWLAATSRDRPGVRIMRVDPRTNRFAGPSIDISPAHPKYLYAGLGVAGSFIQVSDHSVWVTLFSDGAVVRVGV